MQIPVPQIYAWSARVDNPVGAEYIIMEEAPGTKLEDVWDGLPLADRIAIMKDLISIEKKLLSISFSRYEAAPTLDHETYSRLSYGNLYYSNELVGGAVIAEVVGDVFSEVKSDVSKRFVIGPVVESGFWSKERSSMDIDRGPCMLSDCFRFGANVS